VTKEFYSSGKLTRNIVFKGVSKDQRDHEKTLVISSGVTNSKEERLEAVLNIRRKLSFDLKKD